MIYTDLLFVFAFLPITIIFSFFDRSAEYKNLILVISSLIFFSWGRPAIILLLFLTAIFDYAFGLIASNEKKLVRTTGLVLDLLMNGATFAVFSWNFLFRPGGIFDNIDFLSFSDKLIPVGIGFYTVKGASYVLDVYFNRIKPEKNPFCILTYMVSYHFMLAGPVVRYGDISREIRSRRITPSDLNAGLTRFIIGLGKAVILAPAFYKLYDAGLDFGNITFLGAWAGMLGFIGFIYWGFSGFTDMALGLGKTNGFTYPENVRPLRLRNHVRGIATGFNLTLTNFFRRNIIVGGKGAYPLRVIATAFLIGCWYSLSFGSIAGALFFGVFIILERKFLNRFFRSKPPLLGDVYTIAVSLVGVCLFAFREKWELRAWAEGFLGIKTSAFTNQAINSAIKENWTLLLFGTLFALPVVTDLVKKLVNKAEQSEKGYALSRALKTVCTATVLVIYTVEAYYLV